MFLHAPSNTLVTQRRGREFGDRSLLEFVDADTLQVRRSISGARGSNVRQYGDLFGVIDWNPDRVAIELGHVASGQIECTAEVTEAGFETKGDAALLDSLPYRTPVLPGQLVELDGRELRVRRFRLDDHLAEGYSNEMPTQWRVTPDGRHAIIWRTKGSPEWPVIDLDTDEVMHRIQGRGYNEPHMAFHEDGSIWVAVFDQLHRLESIQGQLSEGIRLKNDNSGSLIESIDFADDGTLLIMWFGRSEPAELREVESMRDLVDVLKGDQRALIQSLANAGRYGYVLRFDTTTNSILDGAAFQDWVVDPVLKGDVVTAAIWGSGAILRANLEQPEWLIYPAREPDARMWF